MNTIVIYPGRFQPFGAHHAQAYRFLTSMFGSQNVYVATSNVVKLPESPFTFEEKLQFIKQYVPSHMIQMCKNLYKAEEILSNYDLNSIRVVFAYSYKDIDRIAYIKNDGSQGYFLPYALFNKTQYTANQHGYILVLPEYNIKFHGRTLSGTYIRFLLKKMADDPLNSSNIQEFKRLFGFFDKKIYSNVLNKFK